MAEEIDITISAHKVTDIDVATLCDQFTEAHDTSRAERELAEQCRDYYAGDQLTEIERETLKRRRQPEVISNRIAPKIDALLGYQARNRTDPKAYPRTPMHEDDAHSVTDALRFVCETARFDETATAGAENLFIEGLCAATVGIKMVNDSPEVTITRVPWDRYYRDPHSRAKDFSDASYHGVVVWMDEADATRQFNGKEDVIEACYGADDDTFGDRPGVSWGDLKRRRVRVLQHRFRHKGEWWTCIFCKGGYLRDPQVSPYVDHDGVPQCDLIATSAYIDRENHRYGVCKRMLSPQDEINKRRSKALHLLNSRKIVAEKGAVPSIEQARKEAARPDGYIEINPDLRFEFVDEQQLVAGQLSMLQESKAEIDASGVNPAIEGDAMAPSGRAQQMMMQAGLSEMSGVFDALKRWEWEIYRQVWYRIRQYWTSRRWVRVTDDIKNLRWVEVNKPITRGDALMSQAEESGDPEAVAAVKEAMQADPRMQEVVGHRNKLAELDIDIIVEDGPDSITIQSEQFEALIELKRADPSAITTKAIIEASSLRNKDEILKSLEEGGIPLQLQQQMQQMQQALQQAQQQLQEAKAKQADHEAEHALKAAELRIKEQEAATRQFDAETKRIAMQAGVMDDEADNAVDRYNADTARIKATSNPAPDPPNGGFSFEGAAQ